MRFPTPPPRYRILWIILTILMLVALLAVRLRSSLPFASNPARRVAELVYLVPTGGGFEIARSYDALARAQQPTETGGKVREVSVRPDEDNLLYSMENEEGGTDLWLMQSDGSDARMLVNCAADRCGGAAWSHDGARMVFTRQNATGSHPYLWDAGRDDIRALTIEDGASAQEFAWSPVSDWLAYSDPSTGRLRIYNLETGEQVSWDAVLTGAPAWSPDGRQIAYTSEETLNGFARVRLFIYDLQTAIPPHEIITGPDGVDISPPQWSPDGTWLLIGQRTLPGSPAKQLFLIQPDGSNYEEVIQDFTATHTSYRWSPDGERIVFQKYALGSSQNTSEIWLWQRSDGALRRIAEKASQPQWLP